MSNPIIINQYAHVRGGGEETEFRFKLPRIFGKEN